MGIIDSLANGYIMFAPIKHFPPPQMMRYLLGLGDFHRYAAKDDALRLHLINEAQYKTLSRSIDFDKMEEEVFMAYAIAAPMPHFAAIEEDHLSVVKNEMNELRRERLMLKLGGVS